MSRVKWKGFYTNTLLVVRLLKSKEKEKSNYQIRSSEIVSNCTNKYYKIHRGNTILRVKVTKKMVGLKFGEFCSTRKNFLFKRKKKKK